MSANTRAPSTIVTIALTGQTEFNIPFEYLARKYVEVTLLGIDRLPLVLNTDFRFVTKTLISLTRPYTADYTKIELRRVTSATERLVDFHDGSILRAYDLNLSQIQTLHVAEEARDLTADTIGVNDEGHLDARNRKIVNLAYAENGSDAIPLGQVIQWNDSAYNSANRAEAERIAAEAARDAAKGSENAARVSEQNADASRQASHNSAVYSENEANKSDASAAASEASYQKIVPLEQSAVTNAGKAKDEADRAEREADRAKTEADKLQNNNEFASTLEDVDAVTLTPNFKGGIGVGKNTSGDCRYDVYNGSGKRSAYFGRLIAYPDATHLVSESGRLEIKADSGGIGLAAGSSSLDYSAKNFGGTSDTIISEARSYVRFNTPVFGVSGAIAVSPDSVGGINTVGLDVGGSPPAGGWVCKTQYKWFSNSVEFGLVRGGSTDINASLLRINNEGSVYDWRFGYDGSLTLPAGGCLFGTGRLTMSQGTLQEDGNMVSGIFYNGTLHNELNGNKQWRSPDPSRAYGWTAIGNGWIEMRIDGAPWGVSFNASDKRLKENIEPTNVNASAIINEFEFVDFDWGNEATFHEGHVKCGLVAQDVEKIDPQFITGVDKAKMDEGYRQLHLQNLLTLALKAVQEQDERIKNLEAMVEKLSK